MPAAAPRRIEDEAWIVQEKVRIEKEYRVHSIEDRVIDDLTLLRYGTGDIPGERDAPNTFVQRLLDRLPGDLVVADHIDRAGTADQHALTEEGTQARDSS